MTSPLEWFGLPSDADEREIKRAYAKRLKTVRPDTDPAGFQQLHDMYQHALAWRQHVVEQAPAEPIRTEPEAPSPPPQPVAPPTEAPSQPRAPLPPQPAPPSVPHLPQAPQGQHPSQSSPVPPQPSPAPPSLPHAPRPPQAPVQPSPPPRVPAPAPLPPKTPAPPRGQWHPVQFTQPVAAEPPAPRFDPDAFVADYLDTAVCADAANVQGWLQQRQELWSLRTKHEAGRAVLQRLFRDPPPISMSTFEATLQFFDLDHALAGIDPLQLQKLRVAMQERHALVKNIGPGTQSWGASRQRLDVTQFFHWFCEVAEAGHHDVLAANLYAQPALRSLTVRQQAAPRLLERLLRERPPMPQDCASLLLNVFGLGPLLTQRGQHPGELVANLHMQWLTLPRNIGKLTLQVKEPGERFGDPAKATRRLRWLQRPFQWWWITLAALVPKLLHSMGLFAWRFSGGVPSRLDEFFDPRLTRFCIATADRNRVTRQRVWVGAVRCALLLLIGAGITAWMLASGAPTGDSDAWMPLIIGGGITACWLYYLSFTALLLWQQRPEQPVQPRPLLRLGLIPALVAAGLALSLLADQLVAAQALLLSVAVLSYLRYQRRNPRQRQFSPITNVVVLIYIVGMAAWVVLRFPVVSAGLALGYWLADLARQRKQLQLRYRPPAAALPVPADAG